MLTLEREISSIETANINKETLVAMQNASSAMKKIHNGLTIDKVDNVMEDLRDQHAIGEEIAEALTQGPVGQGVDEEDLDEELKALQEEELDNKMLKTGTVPVSDQLNRLPNAAVGERESFRPSTAPLLILWAHTNNILSQHGHKSPRTTKRRSSGSCRRRWPCDIPSQARMFGRTVLDEFSRCLSSTIWQVCLLSSLAALLGDFRH